jgi:Phosphotransferase enzyme family
VQPDWVDPAWRAEADRWAEARLGELGLERTGAIEQPHVRPWATALRIPTTGGDVWFKANMPGLEHEARLVALLAQRRPDCIPPLLAHDPERGWMLMADAGSRLRDLVEAERDLTRWLDILSLYAGVQVDLTEDADAMVALGVPDIRLERLPGHAEALLDEVAGLDPGTRRGLAAALPEIRELCDELDAFGVPATIQHDDFHDAQVYVRDGDYLLLDWGDACVSHPFFTMAVTLDGVIAWGVDDVEVSEPTEPYQDAYLRPFAAVHGGEGLVAACTIARRLGWVCRAVNGYLAPFETEQTGRRLKMFLDGTP